TNWKLKTEKYKTNKKFSEYQEKADELFTIIQKDFTLKFFDGVLKLQSLENLLNKIFEEIEDSINLFP
ncbi:40331_t:CDS:1, partial [Gigaspora margarita]